MSADNLAKSLDPDQAQQNVEPGLDPNGLTLSIYHYILPGALTSIIGRVYFDSVPERIFLKKLFLKKVSTVDNKKIMKNYPG